MRTCIVAVALLCLSTAGAQAAWTSRLNCKCGPVRCALDEDSLTRISATLRTSRSDPSTRFYIKTPANSRVTPAIPELLRILDSKAKDELKPAVRSYTCTPEKVDGKWAVKEVEFKWLS